MADSLIPLAARKGRILDIGCGAYPSFLMNVNFRKKYAVDKHDLSSSEDICSKESITFHQFDLEKETTLPFDRDFFDVVTMLAVIEHVQEDIRERVVGEVYRTLKPGGVYIITTPAPWTKNLLKVMSLIRLVSPDEIHEHKGAWGHTEILGLLKAGGFNGRFIDHGDFELFMSIWVKAIK